MYAALNSGDLTITEMRETVLHFAVYAGWPKASRFNIVVDEQWARIIDERGESARRSRTVAAAGHRQRSRAATAGRRRMLQGDQLHPVRADRATTRTPGRAS